MACECAQQSAKTDAERKTLRIALKLNVMGPTPAALSLLMVQAKD
jgi:hypothetical protein